jgi:hypothetical protein
LVAESRIKEMFFEVTEITDDEYGFTLEHPVDWISMTRIQLCKAIH